MVQSLRLDVAAIGKEDGLMEKRILFVDDEEAILQVMQALFRRQGYVALHAVG
jgi:hypothetical protein